MLKFSYIVSKKHLLRPHNLYVEILDNSYLARANTPISLAGIMTKRQQRGNIMIITGSLTDKGDTAIIRAI
jgi:hypothetical protein